ncbi:hypothetical protein PybrP1_004351 [[Pythium] brassicae (nom. inval.)]|nr:hypothetical protein PybrP1_004351 [[Pythium] brassicae (nom. inval.)]
MASEPPRFVEAAAFQAQRNYAKSELSYRLFRSLTIGVLGFGAIGQATGRLFKDAGFQPTPLGISNDLEDVLATSDSAVSILPSTPATRYLLTEATLAACADKKPVFINAGRGDVVSAQTLLRALALGYLSTAVLDVFETEPLPRESALWMHPSVHVTPHVAAKCFVEDVADTFAANLDLYFAEKPMNYAVDWASGY